MSEPSDAEILFERRGAAGIVTLNRPRALNALTLAMIRALRVQLDTWREDPAVTRVIIAAAGGRAFSAGGDLRAIYDLGRAGRQVEALPFFREEYQLNALIKHYPKPYVALIDGIVMGGGVGVSVHGSHRVAGEHCQFAMPEVGIGFFPDVGGTWFLPRLAGKLGTYCALTGDRLALADVVSAGIATHHVPAARHPELLDGLCGTVPVDAIVTAFSQPVGDGPQSARQPLIDRVFAGQDVEDILARLETEAARGVEADWASRTAAGMRMKAPLSLKLALAQMQRGAGWSFSECMRAEFRIVSRVLLGHDFYEGVRAVIIEKDNRPHWQPGRLGDVSAAEVERHFAAIGEELVLP
jgi:enoyl-CoA hydratase/carnithine racemase